MIADEENENSDCGSGSTNNTSFEMHEFRRSSSPARESGFRDVTSGLRPGIRETEEEEVEKDEVVTETIYIPNIGTLRVDAVSEV